MVWALSSTKDASGKIKTPFCRDEKKNQNDEVFMSAKTKQVKIHYITYVVVNIKIN